MPIYPPVPRLTSHDKRLLRLLGELLLHQEIGEQPYKNLPDNAVPLSDLEAVELLSLFETLLENREFREKVIFVENMVEKAPNAEDQARKIYLRGRKQAGRSRAMSSAQWHKFQVRLGIVRGNPTWAGETNIMDFEYFLKMENRFLNSLEIHPRVRALILELVNLARNDIEDIRLKNKKIKFRILSDILTPLFNRLKSNENIKLAVREVSKYDLAAAFTLISNSAVMFTTRDWGVAGTISTMAGALIAIRNR